MRGNAERLQARLRAHFSGIGVRVGAELAACARACADEAREMAPEGRPPRREKRLKDSFGWDIQGLRARAYVTNPHAAYVEFGTGIRGAATGRFAGGYDGEWPGMEAQPYMYPAAQIMRGEFAGRMARAARGG